LLKGLRSDFGHGGHSDRDNFRFAQQVTDGEVAGIRGGSHTLVVVDVHRRYNAGMKIQGAEDGSDPHEGVAAGRRCRSGAREVRRIALDYLNVKRNWSSSGVHWANEDFLPESRWPGQSVPGGRHCRHREPSVAPEDTAQFATRALEATASDEAILCQLKAHDPKVATAQQEAMALAAVQSALDSFSTPEAERGFMEEVAQISDEPLGEQDLENQLAMQEIGSAGRGRTCSSMMTRRTLC